MSDIRVALFEDPVAVEAFAAGLRATPLGAATEECRLLTMHAFRCAELHGFRNPECLALRDTVTRCFAKYLAADFLDRVELCEVTYGKKAHRVPQCETYREDLRKVVEARTEQHAADVVLSDEEQRAVHHCGLPTESHSIEGFASRVSCLAPLVCSQEFEAWRACKSGACPPFVTEDLMHCLGASTARLNMHTH